MDSKKLAEIDQASKLLADVLPSMLYGLYKKSIEAGFTESQAMQIALKYLENFRPQAGE